MAKNIQHIGSQLIVKAPQRQSLDVGQWRQALKSADQDKVKKLFDLFEDLLVDGVLSDALDKRITAVINTPLTFVDAEGSEVEQITALMDTSGWEDMLHIMMKARFWGRSAMEFDFTAGFGVAEIPASHINLAKEVILIRDSDTDGESYEGSPFLLVLGKRRDFGLMLKAAPYVIYKRGGFGDWAQWIELFGMPQRVGKYNVHDPESKRQLEEAFETAGSAPYLIVPEGAIIEKLETSSGNGAAYDSFRAACNEEILITILGQTMTTVQGDKGARSLGEVHQEVEAGKHKSDLRYVQRILNQHIKPRLEAMGYPVEGGSFVFPEEAEHLDVAEIMQLSDIMDIPKYWLHEKYAIPMAQEGEEIARRQTAPMMPGFGSFDEDEEPETTTEPIANSDTTPIVMPSRAWGLFDRLSRFFGVAPSLPLGAITKDTLQGSTMEAITLADASADAISTRLINRVALGEAKTFDLELYEWLSARLTNAIRTAFVRGAVRLADDIPAELAYSMQNDALATAMEVNLYRFSMGKTLKEVQLLNQAFRDAPSYAKFIERAKGITSRFNEKWLRTEYDTALLTAQSAVKYQELMRKTKVFPYWRYRTLLDNKVRAEHKALNGLVLPADDKAWNEIYPPNGWNCRCTVEPVMAHEAKDVDLEDMRARVADYMESDDWQTAKKHGFDGNRAKGGVIFDKNQQYMNELNGKHVPFNDLSHEEYGIPTVDSMIEQATSQLQLITTDRDELWEMHAGADAEVMILTDYRGRKVFMPKKNFLEHTDPESPKYAYRSTLFQAALETLKTPDEVWVNKQAAANVDKDYQEYKSGKKNPAKTRKKNLKPRDVEKAITQDGVSLIRYYKGIVPDRGHNDDKGTMMVVRYRLTDRGIQMVTWFDVDLNTVSIDNLRSGLLVRRKN